MGSQDAWNGIFPHARIILYTNGLLWRRPLQSATSRGTLYTELGVEEQATPRQIRSAYLEKAKEIHPDRVPEGAERQAAERRMARLNVLMGVLGDEAKRAVYDLELKRQRAWESASIKDLAAELQLGTVVPAWRTPWALAAGGLVCLVVGWTGMLIMSDTRETEWWHARQKPALAKKSAKVSNDTLASVAKPVPVVPAEAISAQGFAERPVEYPVERSLNLLPTRPIASRNRGRLVQTSRTKGRKLSIAREPTPPPVRLVQENRNVAWEGAWKAPALELSMHNDGRKVRGSYKAVSRTARLELSLEGWADNPDVLSGVWVDASGARGEFAATRTEGTVVDLNWWTTAFPRKGVPQRGSARLQLQ